MSTKVVLVGGSRWYADEDSINMHLDSLLPRVACVVVTGGERGPARIARKYALKNDMAEIVVKPEFMVAPHREFDQRDFFSRNQRMVDMCDEAIFFWDGVTSETKDLIRRMDKALKPYIIISTEDRV